MDKFYKLGFVFYFLFFFNTNCKAQLTHADSTLFNAVFTGNLYISYWAFPYKWYVYDSITSAQSLTDRFSTSFPFTPSDLNNNTYNGIHNANLLFDAPINASFNALPWIYNQTDPVMNLPFELNGKLDTAYTAFSPGVNNGSCKTAFLLIHGNGVNTTTQFLQGIGYAALYCNVKSTCVQHGDVYTYCKPNEDWRAIYWNRQKLNDYVFNYCEAIGHNYGTNYLIETIALVKSLKTKYSKIVILGLSEGGYTTLLNALNTEPDGAVVSGGYSIDFDSYPPSQFVLSNRFGNAPQYYKRDTVKARLENSQSNILFTWGQNDNVDLMDPEHDFHYTQNFFNNSTNSSYFYNFNNHTFPPCYVLDSFIQRIKAKPKAFIVPVENVCSSDSMQIKIGLCGQSPFQFEIFKDGIYFTTLNTNSDTIPFTLYSPGNYQIKNVDDASIHTGINSNSYTYIKDSSIGFAITNKHFNCDSNLTEIDIQLNGTSPWYLSSSLYNLPVEDTFYNNAITKKYTNAELVYLQVTDGNNCFLNLNQNISISDSLIDFIMSAPIFDCDSNKTKISFDLKGRSPWNLQFKKNGLNQNLQIDSTHADVYFYNGLYEFLSVSDSNQCQKNINQIYNFNYDSLVVQVGNPMYNCDSSKTAIVFNLQGNAPWTINYTKDAVPLQINTNNAVTTVFFDNGNYDFQSVTDATACVKNINQIFNFNNSAINYTLATPSYNCDSNKTQINFDLQGNAPWTIEYTMNGMPLQITTNLASIDPLFENGLYQFITVSDVSCTKNINQSFAFNKDSIDISLSNPMYNCDSSKTGIVFNLQGNAPWTINYTKDAVPLQINTNNSITTVFFENGNYDFQSVTDATACVKNINQIFNFNNSAINYTLATPSYNCDSNKTQIHFDLQGNAPWIIDYTMNGMPLQINTNTASIDPLFENGLYQFISVSDLSCIKNINQSFTFNKDSIDISLSNPMYNCDSSKTAIVFSLQGNAPWTINYTKDAVPAQMNTNNAVTTVFFENGNYDFQSVTDATACVKNINQIFNFNNSAINYTLTTPSYNCDSNKTQIHFDLQGNAPWTIDYTMNGIPLQITTNLPSIDPLFENGLYQFISVSDLSCIKNINQSFTFNKDSIDITLNNPMYNCDSSKTAIVFSLQGNAPWTINYTKDAVPLQINTNNAVTTVFFENGNYDFQSVTDATACVKNINQIFNFNNSAINYTLATPSYNCDSNKTQIHFDLQGNPPWIIDYTMNGIPLQITTNLPSIDPLYENGLYQFISVSDLSCIKNINQSFAFNKDSIDITLSNPMYNCDSNKTAIVFSLQGNAPWTINYTKNAVPLQIITNSAVTTVFFDNGNYDFQTVKDATSCVKNINHIFNFNSSPVNYSLGTPIYNCDSNKTQIHFDLQGNAPWIIDYTMNGMPLQITTNLPSLNPLFENGLYQFISVSDVSCTKNINQSFAFNKDSIDIALSNPIYNCDSNKTAIVFSLQGNAPWTINYTKNAVPLQINTNNAVTTVFFNNGNYDFQTVKDATSCVKNINQNFNFNYSLVNYSLGTPTYNCDSNKTQIHFDLQGNAPWTIDYSLNGTPLQITSNLPSIDPLFENGLYQFISVSDATCSKNINQSFAFSYTPILGSIVQQAFDCDSNKYKVNVQLAGNGPWTISYNNGIQFFNHTSAFANTALFLSNGNWVITKVKDATNCEYIMNDSLNVNYTAINAIASAAVYDCDSNKSRINFTLSGNAPWEIDYTLQNIIPVNYSIQTYDPNFVLYLSNGLYVINQVKDSTNCVINLSLPVNNFYTPFTVQKNPSVYNCDSTKMQINYSFTGDAPYTLLYKNNISGIIYQLNSMLPTINFYLGDGDYTILSAHDIKCNKIMEDTIHIAYPKLNSNFIPAVVSCDSNKMFVQFSTPQGNKPYTYYYYFNNQYLNFTTYANLSTLYLPNGNYFFEKVTDSMGCSVYYNQSVNAHYIPFQYLGYTKKYLCEKDSTEITFNISHSTDVHILYSKNGGPIDSFIISPIGNHQFILSDGSYSLISIRDSIGCIHNINNTLIINNEPVDIHYTISMDCDLKQYTYHFDLKGKSPWTLNYNYLNTPKSLQMGTPIFDWDVLAGNYYISNITDSNGCTLNINNIDTLGAFLNDFPTLYYKDFALVTIQTPFQYYWYKDDVVIDSNSKTSIPSYGNGVYKVLLVDSLGCSYWSNEVTLGYPTNINVFPNPVRSATNIVVNDFFGDSWNYQLYDMKGELLEEKNNTIPSAQVDMKNYAAGVYSLIIRYKNESPKNKTVIRIIKQ